MLTDDDMKRIETVLDKKLGDMESRLVETFAQKDDLRDMETKLLTAFHQWTASNDKRMHSQSDAIAAIELDRVNLHSLALELIVIRQRLDKLEGAK